ncbi:MAG: response regulator transcription factor [Patescibacteria group bacterium]|jgi:DNA-binding response OmpR family regulator
MRILIVEDEHRLANVIKKGLVEEGYAVDVSYDGKDGLYMSELNQNEYDTIILDINLPKIDGFTLCKRLRDQHIDTPVLILSAIANLDDKVKGLDCGADDYLTKPFAFKELNSRIHALIRRSKHESSPTLKIADLELDPISHSVKRQSKNIKLTPKEFSILEYLMRHKDSVVTRSTLIEHVWDYNYDGISNIVDVFVAAVRKKIDKDSNPKLIHTLHGVGYKISEE